MSCVCAACVRAHGSTQHPCRRAEPRPEHRRSRTEREQTFVEVDDVHDLRLLLGDGAMPRIMQRRQHRVPPSARASLRIVLDAVLPCASTHSWEVGEGACAREGFDLALDHRPEELTAAAPDAGASKAPLLRAAAPRSPSCSNGPSARI